MSQYIYNNLTKQKIPIKFTVQMVYNPVGIRIHSAMLHVQILSNVININIKVMVKHVKVYS